MVIATVLFSAGNGAQVVASLAGTHIGAQAVGTPNNVATYDLVGGMFNFVVCISFFLGFSVGGVMLDTIRYQWASKRNASGLLNELQDIANKSLKELEDIRDKHIILKCNISHEQLELQNKVITNDIRSYLVKILTVNQLPQGPVHL